MVLQSKVFLIVALQKFSPIVSKRRTFIRRVKQAVSEMALSRNGLKTRDRTEHTSGVESSSVDMSSISDGEVSPPESSIDIEGGDSLAGEMTPREAMRLFTKIPFPEPKRVIQLRPRTLE
jgi:hypothetical protein